MTETELAELDEWARSPAKDQLFASATRQEFCRSIPSVAQKRPDLDILARSAGRSAVLEPTSSEIHAVLYAVRASCDKDNGYLDLKIHDYDCETNPKLALSTWLKRAIKAWRPDNEPVEISCLNGAIILDNQRISSLHISESIVHFHASNTQVNSLTFWGSTISGIKISDHSRFTSISTKYSNSFISGAGTWIESSNIARLSIVDSGRLASLLISNSVMEELEIAGTDLERLACVTSKIEMATIVSFSDKPAELMNTGIVGTSFGYINITNVAIGGFGLNESYIARHFRLNATVERALSLKNTEAVGGIELQGSSFAQGAYVDLRNVKARYLQIGIGTFRGIKDLNHPVAERGGNAFVKVYWDGAAFGSITAGGYVDDDGRMASEPGLLGLKAGDFIALLSAGQIDGHFNPQPFAFMAKLLTEYGYRDTANALHAHRVGESLRGSASVWSRTKLAIGWVIGYGYKPDGVIVFLFGEILIGWLAWLYLARSAFRALRYDARRSAASKIAAALVLIALPLPGSLIRIFPDVGNLWSLTPKAERFVAVDLANDPYNHWFFTLHAIIGSTILFLLLTPLTGIFD